MSSETITDPGRALLATGTVDVDAMDSGGWTPLMLATKRGHCEVVRLLLAHGAVVNAQNEYGGTALRYAAVNGDVQIVSTLLEAGADLALVSTAKASLLVHAIHYGYFETARLLLDHGCSPNDMDKHMTALAAAVRCGNEPMVQLLLERGAHPDRIPEGWWPPLFLAAERGHTRIAALLVTYGADVHATTENGGTALTRAQRALARARQENDGTAVANLEAMICFLYLAIGALPASG